MLLCSAHALPKAYQALMTDAESKIIDFYSTGKVLFLELDN
jgi:5'-3' exonuclease